jgi:hypothetical protein
LFEAGWLEDGIRVSAVVPVHQVSNADEFKYKEKFEAADIILAQRVLGSYPCRFVRTEILNEEFPWKVTSVVNCYFEGYNPELFYIGPSSGRIQGPLGDYHQEQIFYSWLFGRGDECVEMRASDYVNAGKQSLEELKLREHAVDIKISDWIEDRWESNKLFHVMNHPANSVLTEYVERMAKYLGLKNHKLEAQKEFLAQIQCPINRVVAKRLGIAAGDYVVGWKRKSEVHLISDFFQRYDEDRSVIERWLLNRQPEHKLFWLKTLFKQRAGYRSSSAPNVAK